MRTIAGWLLVCGVALAAAPNTFAEEQDDASAILDQAIKAHGGAEALNKAQTLVRTGAGTIKLVDSTMPFTDEVTWSLPDRLRVALLLDKKIPVTTVINGSKGWRSPGGPAIELGPESMAEMRDELYVFWLATLTPLKKDEFKLASLPEIKVNNEPAIGFKVASKGRPDAKLYFDKKTNLLVKIERRSKEAGLLVDKEYIYGDHKEFDGVKLPTKEVVQINGRKYSEVTGLTYKLQKKIDDTVFAKP